MGDAFELVTERLGCLPVVDHFCGRVGLDERLGRYLPTLDRRVRVAFAAVVGLVVRNIVVGHRPLYAIGEWAEIHEPGLLGLSEGDAAHLTPIIRRLRGEARMVAAGRSWSRPGERIDVARCWPSG